MIETTRSNHVMAALLHGSPHDAIARLIVVLRFSPFARLMTLRQDGRKRSMDCRRWWGVDPGSSESPCPPSAATVSNGAKMPLTRGAASTSAPHQPSTTSLRWCS